ncbi:MAG: hypothetical protein SF339_10735 [Blastocatellia bacterium]|nr:hypothetical protein [Blastocatellia bacterium]
MAELKYQHGRLSYRRKSTGHECGREDWSLTRNRDGSTTLRALVLTDEPRLVRDVVYTRDARGFPIDAFIRLQVEDRHLGSAYFRVDGDQLLIVADGPDIGRTDQTIRIPTDFFAIKTHAVMLDAWLLFGYYRSQGGEQPRRFYNTSSLWNGADGPLGRLETFRLNLVGDEELTVPAGTFKAAHFTLDCDAIPAPTSHLYLTGEDRILLKYDWAEYDLEYALVAWKIGESW